jgi:uncharacterized protein (DUF2062 family)
MFQRAKPWLDRKQVFSFNREPLARGVAIGAFCGLIPGPLQVLTTFAVCAWWRGNAIAGTVATFYTNPLTIVPLYALAFQVGAALLPGNQSMPPLPDLTSGSSVWLADLGQWMLALGWPLLAGLPAMGLLFAGLSYVVMQCLWLAPVYRRMRRMRRHT